MATHLTKLFNAAVLASFTAFALFPVLMIAFGGFAG